ncbi:MAG: ferrous iron transport protein A [Desulfobulbaceae bacterium]|nr:ferrous iron transport protein A [Desulfobulbaceae bacterium]
MTGNRFTSFFCTFGSKKQCRLQTIANPADALPLANSCCGDKLKVCKITGDRASCARMANLGLLPGCELELLCPLRGENCLVKLNGGTISLDEPSAQNILVTPL